jgi:hypothetical protein
MREQTKVVTYVRVKDWSKLKDAALHAVRSERTTIFSAISAAYRRLSSRDLNFSNHFAERTY